MHITARQKLTFVHVRALHAASDRAGQVVISSDGLTARLNRLEKAGLVTRKAATGDGRSMLVMLTAEGKAISERAFRDDMAFENRVLAPLTRAELDSLETLLRKLTLSLLVCDDSDFHSD